MDYLFQQIISLENLFAAWKEFRSGKRKKSDVQIFERQLEDNLLNLHSELENKTYCHGYYHSFYIRDPKQRNIHKATVRDRVVHHAIYRILYPLYNKAFIHDSYSCRLYKGTHRAVLRLEKFTRQVSQNFTRPCYILKCDVRKFFDSVDHEILFQIIKRKIKDGDALWLLNEVVGSYKIPAGVYPVLSYGAGMTKEKMGINREVLDYSQPAVSNNIQLNLFEKAEREMKGIPIGNLTSQLFANIYMNEFDQFVKYKLRVKRYARYTDDFVIVADNREYLESLIPRVESFLANNLKLALHPNKVIIRKLNQGVDFLGYVVLPRHKALRTRTKRRMFGQVNKDNLSSYLGLLKHCNGYKLSRIIAEAV